MTRVWPKVVLLATVAFMLCIDFTTVRHAAVVGMGNCAVRQFVRLPETVDVLALGSSRVRAGISPAIMSSASGGALSANFNLGRSGLSAMRSYVTLRDALERGVRPRFVYLEIDIDALARTEDRLQLPMHSAIMRWRDIGLLLELHSDFTPIERLRLRLLAAAAKVRGAILPVLGGAPLTGLLGGNGPVLGCQDGLDAVQARRGASELAERRLIVPAVARELDLAPAESRARREELYFVDRVRALCRKHGIRLLVARPGAAYEPALSERSLQQVRALVPEFDEPPADVVKASWGGFLDAYHMGPLARERYSAWLAARFMQAPGP